MERLEKVLGIGTTQETYHHIPTQIINYATNSLRLLTKGGSLAILWIVTRIRAWTSRLNWVSFLLRRFFLVESEFDGHFEVKIKGDVRWKFPETAEASRFR